MKRYNITVNGTAYDVEVEEISSDAPAAAPAPARKAAPAPAPAAAKPSAGAGTPIKAPMPGNILDVKVSVGDSVQTGQVLIVLEALKMENDVVSTAAGKVTSVLVKKGDTVNSDDVLVTVG